jgi:hypothetical protein
LPQEPGPFRLPANLSNQSVEPVRELKLICRQALRIWMVLCLFITNALIFSPSGIQAALSEPPHPVVEFRITGPEIGRTVIPQFGNGIRITLPMDTVSQIEQSPQQIRTDGADAVVPIKVNSNSSGCGRPEERPNEAGRKNIPIQDILS